VALPESASCGSLHLQRAIIAAGGVQCGYCTSGMLISARALLDRNPRPTVEEIAWALGGNLCRCTSYQKIIQAVQRASEEVAVG
jgi:carbon-monoxide dehydrogenase small subunit